MQKMVLRFLTALTVALTVLASGLPAQAQTPQYAVTPGTSGNVFPFSSTTNMVQWVYQQADFTTPSVIPLNSFITTIYIKASGTPSSGTTYTNLQIKMGSTTNTAMTGGTWVGGLTTVFTASSHSITATATGWVPFVLTTPFYYNGGNFYLEVSQTAYTGGMTILQDNAGGNRRQWGTVTGAGPTSFGSGLAALGVDVIPADCSGMPTTPTIATPAFAAALPLCTGNTTSITGVNPNLGTGLSVFWQRSTSATGPWTAVTGGSGATTLTYTTPPISANTYFRMGVNCSFSNLTAYSSAFLVPVGAPQPGVISGNSTFCNGDTATYSVPNVTGTTYTWTLPSGWSGTSTTNSILVTPSVTTPPGPSAGTISVIATSPCGTSIARTRSIVPGSPPAPPASINGNRFICANTSQTYTVPPVAGAFKYVWTLPSGWSGTSTTNSITATNTTTSGNITVRAENGCGLSFATTIPVSVISTLANPGTITGKDTVCSGALQTYSIAPVNGATSYVWTLPSGWSGTTTGTSVQIFGGTSNGSITVTAYVSCATSPISSKPLTAITTVNPTVTINAPASTLCQGLPTTFTATSTGGGPNPGYIWRRNGTAVSATGNTYTTASLLNGDIISVTLNSSAVCASTASVTATPYTAQLIPAVVPGISINSLPTTTICRGTSLTMTATATGGGTTPSYQWLLNGNPILGATGLSYTSSTFSNNDTVTVALTSNATCATATNAGSNKVGVVVAEALQPAVAIAVSPTEILTPGEPVTFTATPSNGGATPDFQWMRNGVNIPFETGSTFTSSDLQPNDHISVRMLSYLSCASPKVGMSNLIIMRDGSLSVGTTANADGLQLYPNPSPGKLSVRGNAAVRGGLRLEVMSAVGQVVHRVELPAGGAVKGWSHELELPAGLADGQYLLRVSTQADGTQQTMATLPFVLRKS